MRTGMRVGRATPPTPLPKGNLVVISEEDGMDLDGFTQSMSTIFNTPTTWFYMNGKRPGRKQIGGLIVAAWRSTPWCFLDAPWRNKGTGFWNQLITSVIGSRIRSNCTWALYHPPQPRDSICLWIFFFDWDTISTQQSAMILGVLLDGLWQLSTSLETTAPHKI